MHPFFHFLGHDIPAYGTMLILAAVTGIGLAMLRAKRRGYSIEDILYTGLYALIGIFIGGAVLGVIIEIPHIISNSAVMFSSFEAFTANFNAGFVFYGGLIGGICFALLYMRIYKVNPSPVLECCAPVIPMAHAIGRIGCFLGGCCYGMPVSWGVIYPEESLAAPPGIPLLPIQLIEAGINILAGIVLIFYTRKPRPSGRAFGFYLIYYAVARFILEFFRYDEIRGVYGFLSTSQIISLIVLPVGIIISAKTLEGFNWKNIKRT